MAGTFRASRAPWVLLAHLATSRRASPVDVAHRARCAMPTQGARRRRRVIARPPTTPVRGAHNVNLPRADQGCGLDHARRADRATPCPGRRSRPGRSRGPRTRNTSRPSVWAPAAFQGWCIRRPPGNGQLDEILVELMIKTAGHQPAVVTPGTFWPARGTPNSVDLGERAGLAQIDARDVRSAKNQTHVDLDAAHPQDSQGRHRAALSVTGRYGQRYGSARKARSSARTCSVPSSGR
jgi:hypothetical protein